MAAGANWTSLQPGRNPTGTTLASDYSLLPAIGSTSGQNPVLPPTNLPSGAPAANSFDPSSVVPIFGANAGPYQTTSLVGPGIGGGNTSTQMGGSFVGGMSGMNQSQLKHMLGELSKTYGSGTAAAIMNFLMSGAGFNQGAVNNLFAALQPGIERSTESLMQQFSTSGNRFGSGAQIGLADYLSQVQLNEGQLETQMYEQSVTDYINTLMGAGGTSAKRIASTPSTLDTVLQGLKLGGAAAGGASAAGVGGTAGSILDVIASLGAAA
jgi:hypothetical protein